MKKLLNITKDKIKAKAGETLVETLVAILICTFASTMLAGGVATAAALNQKAKKQDDALTAAQKMMETKKDEAGEPIHADTNYTVVLKLNDEEAGITREVSVCATHFRVTDPELDLVKLDSYFFADGSPTTTAPTTEPDTP